MPPGTGTIRVRYSCGSKRWEFIAGAILGTSSGVYVRVCRSENERRFRLHTESSFLSRVDLTFQRCDVTGCCKGFKRPSSRERFVWYLTWSMTTTNRSYTSSIRNVEIRIHISQSFVRKFSVRFFAL